MAFDDKTMQQLFDFLDGRASQRERDALELRLERDEALREELGRLRRYRELMTQVARTQNAEEPSWLELDRAVANRVEALQASRSPLGLFGFLGRPILAAALATVLVVAAYLGLRELRRPASNTDGPTPAALTARPADDGLRRRTSVERAPSLSEARLESLSGSLTVRDRHGERTVSPGDRLVTLAGLRFVSKAGTASRIRMGLHEVKLRGVADLEVVAHSSQITHLRLHRGTVRSEVARRGPNEEYQVDAGSYRVVVKGTSFSVTFDPETRQVRVKVYHGRVSVRHRLEKGNERILEPGMDETFDEKPVTTMRLGQSDQVRPKTKLDGPKLRREVKETKLRPRRRPAKRRIALAPKLAPKVEQPAPAPSPKVRKEILIVVPRQQMKEPSKTQKSVEPSAPKMAAISRSLRLAVAAAEKGRCADALVAIRPVLSEPRLPGYADALYVAGYCHGKLGRRGESRRFLRAYLRSAPRGRWIRKAGDLINPPRPTLRRLQSQP